MIKRTPLAEVGEFGLIDRLVRAWEAGRKAGAAEGAVPAPGRPGADWINTGRSGLRLGVGDDTAVIDIPPGKALLSTADMLVEDVHFLWSQSGPRSLGRKAMAANISDIAAMGGVPGWAFLSIGVPPGAAAEDAQELYAGMGEMASSFGVVLAGGDTVRSDKWVIAVTLLGLAPHRPITRGGGRPGDLILVTGTVGDSAAGLYALLNPDTAPGAGLTGEAEYLLSRHQEPTPRVWEALALAGRGGVTAMIDVSDGVASEVHHICRNSGCGAVVELARLPVSPQAEKLACAAGQEAAHWALYGGEDYELLFTAPPEEAPGLAELVRDLTGTPVTVIGRLIPASGGVAAVRPGPGGGTFPLPPKGFNHFA
ncbi:MAG: thiamine-phosphate kinase [Peptococcaceae bacterium]|nr:thiamine-phosphate kinase [Peptococcaceae bacterium]